MFSQSYVHFLASARPSTEMNASHKPPRRDDLSDAAKLLREVLKAIPSEEDGRRDAVVRRRVAL
jgi:hypothetical protein